MKRGFIVTYKWSIYPKRGQKGYFPLTHSNHLELVKLLNNSYFAAFAAITASIYALILGAGSSQPSGLMTLPSLGL